MKAMYLTGTANYATHEEAQSRFDQIETPCRLVKRNDGSAVIDFVRDTPIQHGQCPTNAFADHPSWCEVQYRNYPTT